MGEYTSATTGRGMARSLFWIGVLELVLAAGFLIGAFVLEDAFEIFLIMAVVLGLTGIALMIFGRRAGRSAARVEHVLANGIAGTAAITGLGQTGTTMNEQPEVVMDLLVQLPNREPYPAQRKEFVPLILLGRLSSGMPLNVRVDRDDPSFVVIDWNAPLQMPGAGMASGSAVPSGTFPTPTAGMTHGAGVDETLAQVQAALARSGMPAAAPFAAADQANYTTEQIRAHLRQHGLQGTARIDKLADTGQIVGNERLFTMQVTLEVPGQPPRQLEPSAAMVPLTVAHKVELGRSVPVRVAAENPNLLMFEWEKL